MEEYNPGATLWKGSILEPNLVSSGEDSNNSDLQITIVWKVIIINIILCWPSKSSFRAQLQIINHYFIKLLESVSESRK